MTNTTRQIWLQVRRVIAVVLLAVLLVACATIPNQLAAAGAGGLLHPARRHVVTVTPSTCIDTTFGGDGVELKGWRCRGAPPRRGTVVYLHGVADNRSSSVGVIDRFGKRGFDVIAYDSRAHGESAGDLCTYGFFEKRDLHRVIDGIEGGPIVLMGTSLGAAVALQEAAMDSRIAAIVAAETFSRDLARRCACVSPVKQLNLISVITRTIASMRRPPAAAPAKQ